MSSRPDSPIVAPAASPEEAAVIVVALERFRRDTAPAPVRAPASRGPWLTASLHEGVARQPGPLPSWI